jgi:hypothetical protein
MDIITLRILTRKSKLGFGKYNLLTIQQILDRKEFGYLRWAYYSVEGISFIPEILREIGIPPEYEIGKPGKYKELCRMINEERVEKIVNPNDLYNIVSKKKYRAVKNGKFMAAKKIDQFIFSKIKMQSKNHGH